MIVRITCSCGEVIELAQPQAARLKNCPACGAPLQKSALQREKVENFFDSPLLSCPTSLLTAWSFVVGIGLALAAAYFLTVGADHVGLVAPAWAAALLLAASGLWLAAGFALLAELRWAVGAAKILNAAGAFLAILVIALAVASAIMTGPAVLLTPQTWLTVGPMLLIGPICLWFLFRLECRSCCGITFLPQSPTLKPRG